MFYTCLDKYMQKRLQKMTPLLRPLLLIKSILIGLSISLVTSAQTAPVALFNYSAQSADVSPKSIGQTLQRSGQPQSIQLNANLRRLAAGQALAVALPDGEALTLNISQNKTLRNGDTVLLANNESGTNLVLTLGAEASFGKLFGKKTSYSIGYDQDKGTVLVDHTGVGAPTIDLGEDGLVPDNIHSLNSQQHQNSNLPQATGETSRITLLAVYTPEFAAGFTAAETRINQAIAFTNQSMVVSNIDIEFELVHAEQLNFNNNESNNTLLDQATDGEGSFSEVGALRNTHGADMVVVMRFQNSNSSSGIAWINGSNDRFAYSVVQLSPNCCDSVFAHELGHNLGSGHERASVNPSASSPCDFNFTGFSCGHGNRAAGWGTVMSRLNSAQVNHVFSNPNIDCLGAPCGVPEGQTNAADNASSFSISGPLTAAFREDVVAPQPPPPVVPPTTPSTPNGEVPIPAIIPLLLEEED